MPPETPVAVRRLLERCLDKDPKRRLRDVGEARIALDEAFSGPATKPESVPRTSSAEPAWRRALPWALVALLLLPLLDRLRSGSADRERAPTTRPARLDVLLTPGDDLSLEANNDGTLVVLAPDGRSLVYLARSGDVRLLYLRHLDRREATPIPGTDGASAQFFSPDGAWIAYFANGKLMSVPLAGGTPMALAQATNGRGGSWGPNDVLVFSPGVSTGLVRVSSLGGDIAPVTTLEPDERTHRWPSILPDGEHVLFGCQRKGQSYDEGTIEVASIAGGERKVLVRGGTFPRCVGDLLLYFRGSTLYAVRFDVDALELRGQPRPVQSDILSSGGAIGSSVGGTGAAQFSIAADGTAVYLSGTMQNDTAPVRLAVVDRTGQTVHEHAEPELFREPRLSPDGTRVAVRIDGPSSHLHLLDLQRGVLNQFTFDGSFNGFPTWSRDGNFIAYAHDPFDMDAEIRLAPSDSSGPWRSLGRPTIRRDSGGAPREGLLGTAPVSFSPGDELLTVNVAGDIDLVTVADGTSRPLIQTAASESSGHVSPDGRWLVHGMADDTGIGDIYVRAFSDGGGLRRISTGGGIEPHWSRDGREIVYLNFTGQIMAVDVVPEGGTLAVASPRPLLDLGMAQLSQTLTYDVTDDGSRFVVLLRGERGAAHAPRTHATLAFDFLEVLRQAATGPAR